MIPLFTMFLITLAIRRVLNGEPDLSTLPEHHRSSPCFVGVRVAYCSVFYDVSCALLFVVFFSLSFLAMALSGYYLSLSLIVPLFKRIHLHRVTYMILVLVLEWSSFNTEWKLLLEHTWTKNVTIHISLSYLLVNKCKR